VRKFLKKIGYFLLIIFSFVIITLLLPGLLNLDKRIFPISDSENFYRSDFINAFINGCSSDLIIMGNSKSLTSIDLPVLTANTSKKCQHLGYIGASFSTIKLILESYLNQNKKPDCILLEVSWFSFNPDRTVFHPNLIGDLLIHDESLFKESFQYPELYRLYFKRLIYYLTHSFYNKSIIENDNIIVVSENLRKFDITEFEKLFPDHKAGINKTLLEDYISIIRICKTNNIKLILYTAPEMLQYMKMQKDRNEILNIFYYTARYCNDIYYLNYTLGGEYYSDKYEDQLSDSHHLFDPKDFTEDLSKDIAYILNP
jgi:hypothetical protein